MTLHNQQLRPYPLGAHYEAGKLRFSLVSREESCGVVLYDRSTGKFIQKIPFTKADKIGDVYCKYVDGFDRQKIAYLFYENDRELPDERAKMFLGRHQFGKERKLVAMLAAFPETDFDWEDDVRPRIPYEECICYCMHVRGFTRHTSSKVVQRGTFRGVMEKIPYLKETGITTVELQPAYEFLEIPDLEEIKQSLPYPITDEDLKEFGGRKLNYWGYKKGFYYAPKAAYAASEDAISEYKEMVKAFHANGMEVVMQFYFPKEVPAGEISEVLRFWLLEYHIDGFHLMGDHIPVNLLAQDPLFADTKLWYYSFDTDYLYGNRTPAFRNLASYNDDYLYAMRKFLKGDENMLETIQFHMRHVPKNSGRIHYLTNYYGFTLMDMVSYDRKHNEENGEENRDGNDYNCSWNCGAEGTTRKKKILDLRRRQIKNAMLLLMFTQSTPLIFMGDEFGNTQKGNNNPYCQDNATTWLNWNDLDKNADIYEFWKMLLRMRKEHPILRPTQELRVMDYIACGYPDLSYHGQNAWRPQTEGYNRHIGMMFCGKYAKSDEKEDDFFYLALNMHWEPHMLALPKLPKGLKWELLCVSGGLQDALFINKSQMEERAEGTELVNDFGRRIPGRSVAAFISVVDDSQAKAENGKRKARKDRT
ncbi:MAG: hypothetical protein IJ833_11195 [Lachnospiraceae bacterium]|nr:hypothetical protein [Lachnospiraceae bacterium]